jgi:hypothetical protein
MLFSVLDLSPLRKKRFVNLDPIDTLARTEAVLGTLHHDYADDPWLSAIRSTKKVYQE